MISLLFEPQNLKRQQAVKTSNAQLRSLLARMHARTEQDKIRMAREIHDDVSQKLTALSIEISLLQKRLGTTHPETAKLGEILELVSHIGASVRETMNELRPKILDEFGLIPAIKYECRRLEKRSGRKIAFSADPENLQLPDSSASGVFRLFQEVISNALQRSAASEAKVAVRGRNGHLEIAIVECGGVKTKTASDKLALLNMREQISRLGGTIARSSSGKEIRVRLKIPLKP